MQPHREGVPTDPLISVPFNPSHIFVEITCQTPKLIPSLVSRPQNDLLKSCREFRRQPDWGRPIGRALPSTRGWILPPDPPHLRAPMKRSWQAIRKDKSLFVFLALAWPEQPVAITKDGCAPFPKKQPASAPLALHSASKNERQTSARSFA